MHYLKLAYKGRQSECVIRHGGRGLKEIRDGFAAACRRAGLVGVKPHTIQHPITTLARNRGAEVQHVAHLLGHRDSKTTELIYSHLDAEFSAGVVELIEHEVHSTERVANMKDVSPKREISPDRPTTKRLGARRQI
ncbi:MAG: tyrosine-type recombinase/integrase [Pseudomonadota bacterium]